MQANAARLTEKVHQRAQQAKELKDQQLEITRQASLVQAKQRRIIQDLRKELQEARQELEELQADTPLTRAQAKYDFARQLFNRADHYCREQYTVGIRKLHQAMLHETTMKIALAQYQRLSSGAPQDNESLSATQQMIRNAASNPEIYHQALIAFQNDVSQATTHCEELKAQFSVNLTPIILNRIIAEKNLKKAIAELAALEKGV